MTRLPGIAGICAAVLAGTAATALGAPATIVGTGRDAFTQPSYDHDGGAVQFSVTGSTHNVTANAKGPDGKALFRSSTISGGSTPVNGSQYLAPGIYPFFCTVHPDMTSNLVVSGAPQPRPTVTLTVLDKRLARVLKKSALRVKVSATGGGNVPVNVMVGKKAVANRTQLDAAARC